MAKKTKTTPDESLERKLWKAADKLRKNIDAAEYKHVVLGLIFLKYISDAFEELHGKLEKGEGEYAGADPEDKNEYIAEKVFYVPTTARWSYIQSRAKLPTVGKDVDDAMEAIEKDNPSLRGVLPKAFAQERLDKASLGGLIDLISGAALGTKEAQAKDVLGRVYEYFLGEFALAEGKKGGQFYTPGSVVRLLVAMLEPYEGRVFDPCCGSGGMFVQSEKFIEAHSDNHKNGNGKKIAINPKDRISIYGQESNQTTWRLAKMNLAIRGIDSSNVRWNNEGSFLNDAHKDLKADFVIANPPFNDSDWSGELLRDDARWKVTGKNLPPPVNNANYGWIQHFLFHLAPQGVAGFVLADTSLSSSNGNDAAVRTAIIEQGLVDCIVQLPSQLFTNTQITACLWFLSRKKDKNTLRKQADHVLLIDAGKLGFMEKRKRKALSEADILRIANKYHQWRNDDASYIDEPGFCKSVSEREIASAGFVLSPSTYVDPLKQDVVIEHRLDSPDLRSYLEDLLSELSARTERVTQSISNGHTIDLSDLVQLRNHSSMLSKFAEDSYSALLQEYFLNHRFNFLSDKASLNEPQTLPDGWSYKSFSEIFEERSMTVADMDDIPPAYSVTNNGIQPREGNFTKELSKDVSKYKVALYGDMVFGLSREIPNFDVFKDKEGAFSPAYTIYSPCDIRIGLIIGGLMRLKLMEHTDILKGGAREGRGLDKARLQRKQFALPSEEILNNLWSIS